MDISIGIINWNTRDLLERCLSSVFKDCSLCSMEVIVVDNGSSDDSGKMVKSKFSQAILVENEGNVGYCKASNQAIRASRGKFILLLNSDTEIMPGALDSLYRFARQRPDAGAIGPMLLNTDGTLQYSCRSFPSFGIAAMHAFLGLFFPTNPYTRAYKLTEWGHNSEREVDWISGACMFLRRQALEQIGFFDEDYFMYVEDVDLCYRLWQVGWKVYYLPSAKIIHHIAQSSQQSPKMVIEHHKSIYRFYAKQNPNGFGRFLKPLVAVGLFVRGTLLIMMNYFKKLGSVRDY